jgi:TolA-binding protein
MTTEKDTMNVAVPDGEALILQIVQQLKRLREIIRQKNAKIAELEQKVRQLEHQNTIVKNKMKF